MTNSANLIDITDLSSADLDSLFDTAAAEQWRDRLALDYVPSAYQCEIFDFIENGRGHGVVEAVAGAGKTTTIVSAARLISGVGLFLAFNKVIALMLGKKLEGSNMATSTMHAHGLDAVRRAFGRRVVIEGKKYRDMLRTFEAEMRDRGTLRGDDLTAAENKAIMDEGMPSSAVIKLLDLARLNLLDMHGPKFGSELMALADHHNIDVDIALDALVIDLVRLLMQWGADTTHVIDFTDMVWMPTALNLRPQTFAWIFVDECQDISKAHLALIRRSLRPGGRALFVGDPKQAIYGFAGADARSFANIIESTEAKVMPLSVCYRCPTSVVEAAKAMCPQIEARPGAPEGVVRKVTDDKFIDEAREGDMVLCRLNAPLTSLAFRLIASGTSASVRGRDIGKGLVKVVRDCERLGPFARFGTSLDRWEEREIDRATKRIKDEDALAMRHEAIRDQAECVRIVWSSSDARTASALKSAIEALFADDKPSVVLSSVHRAKGLEAERVFIAKPERLGVARASARPWMVEQERNLKYVAYTRAQSELVFIGETAKPAPEPGDRKSCEVRQLPADTGKAVVERPSLGPAPLPAVAEDAPDAYEPRDPRARVALARRIDAALRGAGFRATCQRGETVYHLDTDDGRTIKVYSTIAGQSVRTVGADSIKVAVVRGSKGVGKSKRVNRVGKIEDIVGRVLSRVAGLE